MNFAEPQEASLSSRSLADSGLAIASPVSDIVECLATLLKRRGGRSGSREASSGPPLLELVQI
jgi:hypothetical protein